MAGCACGSGHFGKMYHITDFECTHDEHDVEVFTSPQQCLPVEDTDDSAEQCRQTIQGRSYLMQVRTEAQKFSTVRSDWIGHNGDVFREELDCTEPDSIWTCKQLIGNVLQNFKLTRKFVQMNRNQIIENRSEHDTHFDISSAVRTKQWWLEYCFGSIRPVHDNDLTMLRPNRTGDNLSQQSSGSWNQSSDSDDSDDEDELDKDFYDFDKVNYDYEKVKLGELILWSSNLCPQPNSPTAQSFAGRENNAYAAGHFPQVSFLAELEQTEVINVLRFCRSWLRHEGYRPRLGLWLHSLLALLDPIQTSDVYHELRLLFTRCNQVRIQCLVEASGFKSKMMKHNGRLECRTKAIGGGIDGQCKVCGRLIEIRKQHSTLCLVMVIIVHFFGQKDLIDLLDSDNSETNEH